MYKLFPNNYRKNNDFFKDVILLSSQLIYLIMV